MRTRGRRKERSGADGMARAVCPRVRENWLRRRRGKHGEDRGGWDGEAFDEGERYQAPELASFDARVVAGHRGRPVVRRVRAGARTICARHDLVHCATVEVT